MLTETRKILMQSSPHTHSCTENIRSNCQISFSFFDNARSKILYSPHVNVEMFFVFLFLFTKSTHNVGNTIWNKHGWSACTSNDQHQSTNRSGLKHVHFASPVDCLLAESAARPPYIAWISFHMLFVFLYVRCAGFPLSLSLDRSPLQFSSCDRSLDRFV